MYVTTNSMLVWKRQADESQQSAKLLARVSIGLLIVLLGVVAYAFAAHARYSSLCSTIQQKSEKAQVFGERQLAAGLAETYCD